MRTEKQRQDSIDFSRNYCVHYDPCSSRCGCSAGMDKYKIQTVEVPHRDGKTMRWGPCIGGHQLADPMAHCPKWERRSLQEAEKRANSIEDMLSRAEKAESVISAWRNKLPRGKSEVIECPCCNGRLHLSQSAYNGHIAAKCGTSNCINFIE